MKIGILGASGYVGLELLNILQNHPHVQTPILNSRTYAGKKASSLDARLKASEATFTDYPVEKVASMNLDLVFMCLPHGQAATIAPLFDCKIIDMSADHRLLQTVGEKQVAYGLPELNRNSICTADIIANPGCYATACILSALPLLKGKLSRQTVFDCKSGYSGSGREKTDNAEFKTKITQNAWAYDLTTHRHVAEIQNALGVAVSFTPHVLPLYRGLMCTQHAWLTQPHEPLEIQHAFEQFYAHEPFVRLQTGSWPDLAATQNSPFFSIGGFQIDSNNRLVTVATLDNLMKGAASQAIQNMNLAFGYAEQTGLIEL